MTLDAEAYRRTEAEMREQSTGESPAPVDTEALEVTAKRGRALRHALAEYELKVYSITPGRPLGEMLAG
ncbi:MAG: hypothetical protein WKF78_13520 [Candidatus Limnocylindrales bacterium]